MEINMEFEELTLFMKWFDKYSAEVVKEWLRKPHECLRKNIKNEASHARVAGHSPGKVLLDYMSGPVKLCVLKALGFQLLMKDKPKYKSPHFKEL